MLMFFHMYEGILAKSQDSEKNQWSKFWFSFFSPIIRAFFEHISNVSISRKELSQKFYATQDCNLPLVKLANHGGWIQIIWKKAMSNWCQSLSLKCWNNLNLLNLMNRSWNIKIKPWTVKDAQSRHVRDDGVASQPLPLFCLLGSIQDHNSPERMAYQSRQDEDWRRRTAEEAKNIRFEHSVPRAKRGLWHWYFR